MRNKFDSIIITHGLPDTNSGGSALGIALVNVLKKTFPAAKLAYVSSHANPEIIRNAYPFIREKHPDLEVLPFPIRARADNYLTKNKYLRKAQNIGWVVVTLFSLVFLVFPFLGRWNRTLNRIRESSLVISRGTNIFYDKRGYLLQSFVSKLWLCIPLLYAWRVNVPFVIYAQSIGPIHSALVRRFMRFVLSRAAFVLPREKYSYAYLQHELAISQDKLVQVPDSVFGLEAPSRIGIEAICDRFQLRHKNYVCLVVRQYMEKDSKTDTLLEHFSSLARNIISKNLCEQVVVVTQCHDLPAYGGFECDSQISWQLYERLHPDLRDAVKLIDRPLSPDEAMCIYGGAKYLVTVRLHAAIFAMIAGTPAIAVSYWGAKTRGIFQMLGLDGAFVEKEELTGERLFAKLEAIAKDYAMYCKSLSEKVQQAFVQAQQTPSTFADLLSHS